MAASRILRFLVAATQKQVPIIYLIMLRAETTVIIVGAGLTGIGASYYLTRNNIQHIILEKADDVGGIWSSQKWPGIRCDTDIIKYSYSFKPFLSEQCLVSGEAISTFLHKVCREFGITDKTLFGVEVEKAIFSTEEKKWYVNTDKGVFKANFLINANGYFLDAPHIPDFAGVDNFKGEIIHISHLNKKTNLENKRVVLVGSGASAITAAPALCEKTLSMTLLQRSPSYIYEGNNKIGIFVNVAQKLFEAGLKYPVKVVNYFIQLKDDLVFVLCRLLPRMGKLIFRYHWKDTVDKKTFKDNFQPTYNPWDQRICLSIGLKEAIRNKKLKVATGRIRTFTDSGIILDDGRCVESDLCILATGFNLAFFKFDVFIDSQRVGTEGINFYKGMMMGGIPNYFQPFGPPHSSFTGRIEVISRLIAKIILHMQKRKLDTVAIERKSVRKNPRITPGYVMRSLSKLPAIYGTMQLPSIDNLLFYSFRKSNFKFTSNTLSEKIAK